MVCPPRPPRRRGFPAADFSRCIPPLMRAVAAPVRIFHPAALALALLFAAPGVLRAQESTSITAAPAPASIVPDLTGRTVDEARALLARQKLEVGAVSEVEARGTPGTVARQQPAAGGRAAPGSAVALWLAAQRMTEMPAVMGLPPERAILLIRLAGLRQGTMSGLQIRGSNRVIGHTFRAGERVPAGSVVNLVFGSPPAPPVATRPPAANPPDTPRAAPRRDTLRIAARPQAPPVTPRPDTVRIVPRPPPVVTRPETQRIERPDTPRTAVARVDSGAVPDVRTLDLAAARAALEGAGLAAAFDSAFADSAGWRVAAQAPDAGVRVPMGSPVRLAFAAPASPAATAVPAVAGPLQPTAGGKTGPMRLWIALAVVLMVAAAAGAARMRAGRAAHAAPALTGIRVALRTDVQPRSKVDGPPLGLPRLKLRLRPGEPVAGVTTAGPLFRVKGGGE